MLSPQLCVISACTFLQLLPDSETTQLGAIILGGQLVVAVGVTYFVVKRARQELDYSLLAKQQLQEEEEAEAEVDLEKGEKKRMDSNGFVKKVVEHI